MNFLGNTLWLFAGCAGLLFALFRPKTTVFLVSVVAGGYFGTELADGGVLGTALGLGAGSMAGGFVAGCSFGLEELILKGLRAHEDVGESDEAPFWVPFMALVLVLCLAGVLAFAWTQGWLTVVLVGLGVVVALGFVVAWVVDLVRASRTVGFKSALRAALKELNEGRDDQSPPT